MEDQLHRETLFFSAMSEQQMSERRERREGEVPKAAGSVTGVIVQFECWHPHSRESEQKRERERERELLIVLLNKT